MATKKAWLFATSRPRKIYLSPTTTAPGRWEDREWHPEQRIQGKFVIFDKISSTARVEDADIAKLIKKNRSFRTTKDGPGNIWLVREFEIDVPDPDNPETDSAPLPKRRVQVFKGGRGTGNVVRLKEA